VAVFSSKTQATELFGELFEILLTDDHFSSELRRNRLTVQIIHSNPDFTLFIEPDGVHVDETPAQPVITIKMSCDTAHSLWAGKLLLPLAVATGRLRVRGSMAKVLEFAPLLQPAFDRYPELANAAGIAR